MSWLLASLAILAFALVAGFAWYERSHPSARILALIATLAALAALGRIAFAPLPSVKPTTDIVLLAGFVLGGAPGFAVGATAAIASNVFFGQGPWTPWQMAAWGLVGVAGAVLGRATGRELGRVSLAVACAAAGLAYGALMDLSTWLTFSGDLTLAKLAVQMTAGVPFNVAHAIGNVLFCLAFGPALVAALARYRRRFEVTWHPPGTALAASVAALAAVAGVLVSAVAPAPARAAVPAESVDYLRKAQNADGGFGGAAGQASNDLHTGWAGLGLAAAGRNPLDVRTKGSSVLDYVAAHPKELDDLGSLERTILLYAASGRRAKVGKRDLVAALVAKRRKDGSFAGRVNTTSFAVLALRAAGRSRGDRVVKGAGRWIARQANKDGGFNFDGRGGASGVDDTGAALQALAAAGRRSSKTTKRAATFLVRQQNGDGGFPLQPGGSSNAQSTAWAVQGLLAAGRDPAKVRRSGSRDPLAYLRSLVGADGAVRYSRTSRQTPVWVTAQALTALARKPFPIAATARATRRARGATATASATGAPAATRSATTSRARTKAKARAARRRSATRAAIGGGLTEADAARLAATGGASAALLAEVLW